MTNEQKDEVEILCSCGMDPEDIADFLHIDETEVKEYCAEILSEILRR